MGLYVVGIGDRAMLPNSNLPSGDAGNPRLELSETLYAQLYEIAASLVRREPPDCSLQSTMLVHDAFLNLQRQHNLQGSQRSRLLAAAAQIMRRLLVDHARARRRQKRGGEKKRNSLSPAMAVDANTVDVIDLNDALEALRRECEMTADIVDMKFFGGMTHDEIAEVTGLSARTVKEKWKFAKAWLYRAMDAG
jgi:RNA polymerase sigma factor (TIGR02999 family)